MKAFLKIYLMCALAFTAISSLNAQAARTVLYKDGTLVINELASDSAKNSAEHGGVRNERCIWPPCNDGLFNNTGDFYIWNNSSDVFWAAYRIDITSVIIGSFIQPLSVKYWFFKLENCRSMDLQNMVTTCITDMSYMFYKCVSLDSLDLSYTNFYTGNVTNMNYMFYECGFESLDLGKFNTSNVTTMQGMFMNCTSLKYINLSNFNTENVRNMSHMFDNCPSIKEVNLSSFNTKNVQEFYRMFRSIPTYYPHSLKPQYDNTSLTTIYASPDFVVPYSYVEMFDHTVNLVGGAGTKCMLPWGYALCLDDVRYAKIDGGDKNPGMFTASPIRIISCPDTVEINKLYTIKVAIGKDKKNKQQDIIDKDTAQWLRKEFKIKFSDTSAVTVNEHMQLGAPKDSNYYVINYTFTPKKAGRVQAKIYKECDSNMNLNFSSIRTIQIKTNKTNPKLEFTELSKTEIEEGKTDAVYVILDNDAPWPRITTNPFPDNGGDSPISASIALGFGGGYAIKCAGLKPGTAELVVWATDGSGKYARIEIKVTPKQPDAPSVIETPNKYIYVELGDTFDINFQVLPTTVENSVVWSTDNNWEKILAIETLKIGYGKFAAKDTGHTTLELIASNYDKGGNVKITTEVEIVVSHKQVKEIYDNYNSFDLNVDQTVQLKPSYEPRNATFPYIEYIVEEGDAATVDSSGLVTAVKPGNCTIRAYYWENYNIYTTYTINVKGNTDIDPDVPGGDPETPGVGDEITGLKLDKNELEIALGSSATLSASVLPETASASNLVWSSTNTNVATVDGGVVEAIALGEAKIIVSTKDEAFSDTCHVSVVEQTNIELDAQSSRFKIYPNPTSATVLISGLEENSQLTLLNINGEVLLRKQVSRSTKLDLQAYPNGVYLIRVGEEVQRIVKK